VEFSPRKANHNLPMPKPTGLFISLSLPRHHFQDLPICFRILKGEGAVSIVIKPLDIAFAYDDHVYAIAVNFRCYGTRATQGATGYDGLNDGDKRTCYVILCTK
jgi:hypothetical protein